MNDKFRVMVGTGNSSTWERFSHVLEQRGLALTRFDSVRDAREGLKDEDVLLVFAENQLADGNFEDLLRAAKEARSDARVVIAPSDSDPLDSTSYERAKQLGAYDVLREYYGPKDVEWIVTCALRDEKDGRTAMARDSIA
jgi:DNA-binding NtrC family response regulator